MQRWLPAVCAIVLFAPSHTARAEVTSVSIESKVLVAGGAAFGRVGPYEKLVGRVEIALDPDHARNAGVVDLEHASRADDGRVHFSADLHVLRPVDTSRGNGTLLFDVANRGNKWALRLFNVAPPGNDPASEADFGDGFLMREGYTIVWVGWQFDVGESPLVGIEAPKAVLPQDTMPPILRTTIEVNALVPDVTPSISRPTPQPRQTTRLKRFSDSPCTAWARRGTSACTNAGGPMQAYSMDLRERALLDSDAGMKAADVAVKYRVSGSWVRLLKQRRRETGEVAPRVQRHGRRRMLEPHLHTLAALIAEQPDRTLAELKDALGTPASLATIWRAVAALDVTVKKNGPALRTRST